MTRTFQVAVIVLVFAFCFGTMAFAEGPHFTAKQVPLSQSAVQARTHSDAAPVAGLYALWSGMSGTPYQYYTNPDNSDTYEIWPCFGFGTAASNPDCPSIGSPTEPNWGLEVGAPFYAWPLSISGNDFCDGASTADLPCGQVLGWFEDWNYTDATDDYLYIFTALQGTAYIADTGTLDFGPISSTGPFSETIINDTNFGTWGQTGVNNGNCLASFNYPLTSNSNPGVVYGIAAKKTCVAPVAGAAKLTIINELGTPKYVKSTSPTVCAPAGGPPCYTVTFTVAAKNKVTQTFNIWLY